MFGLSDATVGAAGGRPFACMAVPMGPVFKAGYGAGYDAGAYAENAAWDASLEVRNVWFHDGYTICLFADGQKEKVRYHPEYGYAYDAEKAIMACMLKHACGNRYIKALRSFAGKAPKEGGTRCPACAGCTAVQPEHEWDYDDSFTYADAVECDGDDSAGYRAEDAVECGVVRSMIPGWEAMPEEPGYEPGLFGEA